MATQDIGDPSPLEPDGSDVELAKVVGEVRASPSTIWALLMDFGQPQRLAPSIEHCECLGVGEGAVRRVQARGLAIYEQLVEADADALVFRYLVLPSGDMPLKGVTSYRACVRLSASVSGATKIEWSSRGVVTEPLKPINEALAALYARAIENIRIAAL
jgi:hypothetical protein